MGNIKSLMMAAALGIASMGACAVPEQSATPRAPRQKSGPSKEVRKKRKAIKKARRKNRK